MHAGVVRQLGEERGEVRQAEIKVGETYTCGSGDHRRVTSIEAANMYEWRYPAGTLLCSYKVVTSNKGRATGTRGKVLLRSFARWARRRSGEDS